MTRRLLVCDRDLKLACTCIATRVCDTKLSIKTANHWKTRCTSERSHTWFLSFLWYQAYIFPNKMSMCFQNQYIYFFKSVSEYNEDMILDRTACIKTQAMFLLCLFIYRLSQHQSWSPFFTWEFGFGFTIKPAEKTRCSHHSPQTVPGFRGATASLSERTVRFRSLWGILRPSWTSKPVTIFFVKSSSHS